MLRVNPVIVFSSVLVFASLASAQTPQPLTLRAARDAALANHPRLLGAQAAAAEAHEAVREARAPYFPALTGAVTGVAASDEQARVGAGSLSASRLINRFGQGVVASQLVTDLGRTQNLVASSRLQEHVPVEGALSAISDPGRSAHHARRQSARGAAPNGLPSTDLYLLEQSTR